MGGLGAAAGRARGHAAGHPAGSSADWLPPALPARVAEGVVAEVASEHPFSASSPDDAGVARAEAVLNCVPNRGRRNEEDETGDGVCALRDVVTAVRQLVTFGVDLAPVNVRQTANRFDIVERCLSEREDAYLREGELQELAARLGLRGTRATHEVSAACARAAMRGGDCVCDGDCSSTRGCLARLPGTSPPPSPRLRTRRTRRRRRDVETARNGRARRAPVLRAGALFPERMPDLLASWQHLEAARLVANAGVEPPGSRTARAGPWTRRRARPSSARRPR